MNEIFIRVAIGGIGFIATIIGIKAFVENHYNKDGFNILGYNRDGYNRNGFNKQGFNSEGYNSQGFDYRGYDRNRRNKFGFNEAGYDINGYNHIGYNIAGYNSSGVDCSGNDKGYYSQKLNEMRQLHKSSYAQMKKDNFPYALHDIRIGLEKGVKCIIEHKIGAGYCNEKLNQNIELCSRYGLLDIDFIEKLHSAKSHCNDTQHDTDNFVKTYNQVFFAYKVLEEVMAIVEKYASDTSLRQGYGSPVFLH